MTDPVVLLTVREVASALQVSTMTVYRLMEDGILTHIRVGRNYRIHPDALDAFIRNGGTA